MNLITQRIRSVIVDALPSSDRKLLDDDELLTAHGMDSVIATEIACLLSDQFAISLPPTVAFEFPTLGSLTARVVEMIAEAEAAATPRVAFRTGRK